MNFDDGTSLETDLVFMATGRKLHTKVLGLQHAGIKTGSNGAIVVDKYSRTNVKHIFAVGDVTNRVNLTPVAIREAMAFIETLYGIAPVLMVTTIWTPRRTGFWGQYRGEFYNRLSGQAS